MRKVAEELCDATLNGYSTSSEGRDPQDGDVRARARVSIRYRISVRWLASSYSVGTCGRSLLIVRRADRAPRAARVRNGWRRLGPFATRDDLNRCRTTRENNRKMIEPSGADCKYYLLDANFMHYYRNVSSFYCQRELYLFIWDHWFVRFQVIKIRIIFCSGYHILLICCMLFVCTFCCIKKF